MTRAMGMDKPSEINGEKPRLVVIAGPTASGKSGYALDYARRLDAKGRQSVIINADSTQTYRDLCVLSARPSFREMGGIPHRLYGTRDGAVPYSAAAWARDARRAIDAAHAKDALPILVGGTGMYIATLLDGIAPIPPVDPVIRAQVRQLEQAAAYAALSEEDPESARRLAPADRTRTLRALEVIRSSGTPITRWRERKAGGVADVLDVTITILEPGRAQLYQACDERFETMLDHGAIEEVEALLERKLDEALPVMRAIGVREIARYLRGELTRGQMTEAAQTATRNYAKRQMTWFRHQLRHHRTIKVSSNKITSETF